MELAEVRVAFNKLLKSLRGCDTQASAIKWMAQAYTAMEGSLPYLEDYATPPPVIEYRERIIHVETPPLVIAQRIPTHGEAYEIHRGGVDHLVVYPERPVHPGARSPVATPDPFRINGASNLRKPNHIKITHIQRKGR